MKNYIYLIRYFEKGVYNSKELKSAESATKLFTKLSCDENITYLRLEQAELIKEIKLH